MNSIISFFQSKVAIAIIGTVIFGGVAGLIAAGPFSSNSNHTSAYQAQSNTNPSGNGNNGTTPGASTPGSTPSAGATPGTTPTATPTKSPPTPTPTPGVGQATTLSGTVTSVSVGSNLFKVRSGGVTKTVTVTSQTNFTGLCTNLSGMQTSWRATIHGSYQSDGTFAATSVFSWIDN
jgi:hypothetical protein